MKLHHRRPAPPVFAVLGKVCSFHCAFGCVRFDARRRSAVTGGCSGSRAAPVPVPAKDKKPKQDPALKGFADHGAERG